MGQFKDETGKRYGRWVVIAQAGSNKHGMLWLCQCNCGMERVVRGSALRSGHSKSCGCLARELRSLQMRGNSRARFLPKGEASFNSLLAKAKRSARERGYKWALTREQFADLSKQPCSYCGAEPAQVYGGKTNNGPYIYNGLDRIDNDKGYTWRNVAPCCGTCNIMKGTMTLGEFASQICRIYHERFTRGANV